jgi:MoxR-like ATPase
MTANLIGRNSELAQIKACLETRKNVLLEGPVGVGKTTLALEAVEEVGVSHIRIDGDGRYSEQKLTGWFDPPSVIRTGYIADSFIPGPLIEAMRNGSILLINEINRLPEGVQNILLPAMDERVIIVPKLGKVKAEEDFRVIATQNPGEFIATSHLSEAILDRFEVILLNYQSESEEIEIVLSNLPDCNISHGNRKLLARKAVQIIRATRHDPRIRRGASVRAAISIAEISTSLMSSGVDINQAVLQAALMALPTRIEMEANFEYQETSDKMHHSEKLTNLIQSIVYEDELKKKRIA